MNWPADTEELKRARVARDKAYEALVDARYAASVEPRNEVRRLEAARAEREHEELRQKFRALRLKALG